MGDGARVAAVLLNPYNGSAGRKLIAILRFDRNSMDVLTLAASMAGIDSMEALPRVEIIRAEWG
ncbi:hypothetical protein [Paraburkholderia caribensis]|uniref:hypothetical protein n=1 Tax=Paraburkholderia caribensis TaxID=75105 RepID=UPI00072290C4|nr:hypothetical protein [Paraburkholderia caribensis]ALP64982.1 hypothetical protein AN416_20420 [Paraburkholderia caribensis]AUT53870.1 hypothetical protein C2L66_18090 [Paraburkholderia caribensis]